MGTPNKQTCFRKPSSSSASSPLQPWHSTALCNPSKAASETSSSSSPTTLTSAPWWLHSANLTATLSGAGADGFTVFAPTNKAFSLLPETTLAHLLDPANILELQAVLEYHVLPYVYDSRTRITPIFAYTLEG